MSVKFAQCESWISLSLAHIKKPVGLPPLNHVLICLHCILAYLPGLNCSHIPVLQFSIREEFIQALK